MRVGAQLLQLYKSGTVVRGTVRPDSFLVVSGPPTTWA
jgi:hypothetical protein